MNFLSSTVRERPSFQSRLALYFCPLITIKTAALFPGYDLDSASILCLIIHDICKVLVVLIAKSISRWVCANLSDSCLAIGPGSKCIGSEADGQMNGNDVITTSGN